MRINLHLSNTVLTTIILSGQLFGQADAQPLNQPLDYIAPITLSNNNLTLCNNDLDQNSTNDCFVFHGAFENISWKGDLFAYKVSSNAQVGQQPTWSASEQYAAKEAADANYWQSRRIVLGVNNNTQFDWNNLTNGQKAAIAADPTAGKNIVDFIRGDRTNEVNGMRQRGSILGPIIHSNPVYVGAPNFPVTGCQNSTANQNRQPHIYIGANDGMLHGFNAKTGDETWAYIPSMLLGSLPSLASSAYTLTYYVDGSLNARNVHFSSDDSCRTVLVGSLGAGGKGLFAVDVTDPGSPTSPGQRVLWELSSDNDNDMGHIFGYSSIIKLPDGKWYAANGNGFNSANGDAILYLVDIETGIITYKTRIADAVGLSAPAFVDTNNDGVVDLAYAGDLQGDMYRFDLTNLNGINSISYTKVYDGSSDQPISTAPDITRHSNGYWVLFGTGISYTTADINNSTQAIYGIRDSLNTIDAITVNNLLSRTLSNAIDYTDQNSNSIATVRTLMNATTAISSSQKGWRVELPAGEQLLTPPRLRDGRLKATITQTNKEDARLNENWVIELTYDQDNSNAVVVFDLNNDGYFNDQDRVDGNNDDDMYDREDIPVAWKRSNGLLSQITIARVNSDKDAFFWNAIAPWIPPVPEEGCIGECKNGLEEGHIDVDTDHILGDYTYAHVHEYDDEFQRVNGATGLPQGAIGRTYVDYFNINEELNNGVMEGASTSCSGLQNIDGDLFTTDSTKYTSGKISICPEKPSPPNPIYQPPKTYYPYAKVMPNDKPFIILIANADLSPGAEIIMGKNSTTGEEIKYNVAKYQKMMHQKLASWNGSGNLTDDAGNPLIHTINSLKENGGTLRIQFDSRAIVNGGVIPTNASCVIPNYIRNDRWRNGALTMHLVESSHFLNNANALNRVKVQQPSDLVDTLYIKGEIVNLSEAGGLRANESNINNGFLYESTIFWHYDGMACYGDPDYSEDVIDAHFKLLLAQNGVDPRIANRASVNNGCDAIADKLRLNTPEKSEERKAFIAKCEELIKEASKNYYTGSGFFNDNGDSGSGGDGGTNGRGGPSVLDGANVKSAPGVNQSSQLGRAYWIDIVP